MIGRPTQSVGIFLKCLVSSVESSPLVAKQEMGNRTKTAEVRTVHVTNSTSV